MAFWNRSQSKSAQTQAEKNPAPASASSVSAPAPHAPQSSPSTASPAPQKAPGTVSSGGPAALAGIQHVIAIASGKGGVGKSTVTANLGVALRYLGNTVGLLDADLYGPSQPGMLGASQARGETTPEGMLIPADRNGMSFLSMGLFMQGDGPLVWRAPMAMKAITQFLTGARWGKLDYLLIDLPPGTGDVQLTLAQQARLAGAVIVTTPQEVSLGIAKKGLEMFRSLNIPILGIVENMSGFTCKHCGEETAVFKEGGGEKLARTLGVPFLGALPLDPEIMLSGDEGIPVLEKNAQSAASQAILALANRLDQETRAAAQARDNIEPKSFALVQAGESQELRLEWPDGQSTALDAYTLRVNCGCANCVDENTGKPLLDPARVPAAIRMVSVQSVGRYALTASFTDGHSTGIYPFKKLRGLKSIPSASASAHAAASAPQASTAASDGSLETRIRHILETQINPGVAGHGGKIELVELQGTRAILKMSGGCQGCGAAKVTLKDGVEKSLRAQIPEITEIVDITDHDAGKNPYYSRTGAGHDHSHGHGHGHDHSHHSHPHA
jgi:ATP-binding protein involved in chromosome partitioning